MRQDIAIAKGTLARAPGHLATPDKALLDRLFRRISPDMPVGLNHEGGHSDKLSGSHHGARGTTGLFAIFAEYAPEAMNMKNAIEAAQGTAMIIPQRDLPEEWVRTYAPTLTGCIVAHDFEDADAAIDFCLRLRRLAPGLVIVLTLEGVKGHDFGPERRPICEVTLRRPVSGSDLLQGIRAARDNRAAFDGDPCSDRAMIRATTGTSPWTSSARSGHFR